MNEHFWWKEPLRVIQYNLQVRDTPKMNPKQIARELEMLCANVFVVNAGGIYAWYDSKVPYHHINEFLPQDKDLLKEIIDACHERNIRVVARFDFSKTDDYVYLNKPEWFVREPDMSPRIYGAERPGNWSLLYTTCLNAGYRNEEVAVPVLQEVIDRYDIDGIFFNAPNYEYCCCDACRRKYKKIYGKELPIADNVFDNSSTFPHRTIPADLEPDFPGRCVRDNMENIYRAVKEKASDLPLILYYSPYNENLDDRYATADMICTESQNVLSRGWKDIPPIWHPTMCMKLGNTMPDRPQPFGIIHSCPGMDWRHTGMPSAEYRFWLSQVTAAGGQIWHSLTGFGETISDKRILEVVEWNNWMVQKAQQEMKNTVSKADILLLWNSRESGEGWIEALTSNQIPFDMLDHYQLSAERLEKYPMVILPQGYPLEPYHVQLLIQYVQKGGRLLLEGDSSEQLAPFASIAGFKEQISCSEYLTASYWRFEEEGLEIQKGQDLPVLLPYRGQTAYLKPDKSSVILSTLVPPFAPLHAVGAPPERASIPVEKTDIPLAVLHQAGKGKVLTTPFGLSLLVRKFQMAEHTALIRGLVMALLEEKMTFISKPVNGLLTYLYQGESKYLVHIVNSIGQRPLMNNIPYNDICFSVRIPDGKKVQQVYLALSDHHVQAAQEGDWLKICVDKLEVWDMVVILFE